MLHLANGGATVALLQRAGVGGDIESADEILIEGPVRNRMEDRRDWEARADYLERYLDIGRADYLEDVDRRHALFERAAAEDEAVLWFEEDVFCQINYMDALNWLRARVSPATKLTFVRPPVERLGEQAPERLAKLFEKRQPVTAELFSTAASVWTAVTAEDPSELAKLVRSDNGVFDGWPLLRDGMRAQLARLPARTNGLGRIEQVLVDAVIDGAEKFGAVFAAVNKHAHEYGLGDTSAMRYLLDLAAMPAVLTIESSNGLPALGSDAWRSWTFRITEYGRAVAAGEEDYALRAPLDRWVGGTHVERGCSWRWDQADGLVRK